MGLLNAEPALDTFRPPHWVQGRHRLFAPSAPASVLPRTAVTLAVLFKGPARTCRKCHLLTPPPLLASGSQGQGPRPTSEGGSDGHVCCRRVRTCSGGADQPLGLLPFTLSGLSQHLLPAQKSQDPQSCSVWSQRPVGSVLGRS